MTSERRFDRDLPELLARLDDGPAPDYRDFVVRQTAAMGQRPAWTFPERWLPMDLTTLRVPVATINWRLIAAAALVLLAVVAAALLAAGSRSRQPAPLFGPAANGLIAYETSGDIFVGDPATGATRLIVSGPEVDTDPNFSHDGARLVFLRAGPGNERHLMMANADGTDIRMLSREPFTDITDGDWSADGRLIVIASTVRGERALSVIDTEHGDLRPLDLGLPATEPAFRQPDGRQIAFVSEGVGGSAVYVVDADGSHVRRLGFGSQPRYSPDGSHIAYTLRHFEAGATEPDRVQVHVIDSDGRNDHIVGSPDFAQFEGLPAWSPDGTRLALARGRYEWSNYGQQGVAIVAADGHGPDLDFPMTTGGQGFEKVAWSPDGREVVFTPADGNVQATLVELTFGSSRFVPRWYGASWQRLAP
jgi:Tol biopolymer transport system component